MSAYQALRVFGGLFFDMRFVFFGNCIKQIE